MATAKSTKKAPEVSQESLKAAFLEYVLENSTRPGSVYLFCKHLGIEEVEFYKHFASLTALEQSIWKGFMDEVVSALTTQEEYAEFGIREKLLSFFYGLIEVMKPHRSFVTLTWKTGLIPGIAPFSLGAFHDAFVIYAKELVREGTETGEIAERMFITDYYDEGLWLEVLFVINFWVSDNSADFEKTDAAIEKSVQLCLDLLGRSTLDSVVDFAKFWIQNI